MKTAKKAKMTDLMSLRTRTTTKVVFTRESLHLVNHPVKTATVTEYVTHRTYAAAVKDMTCSELVCCTSGQPYIPVYTLFPSLYYI